MLGVEHGFINETSVILEYIEQTQKGTPLLPSDPFERAQVLALAKEIELYIELPARACYAEAFFGMAVPDAIKDKTKAELLLGFASLAGTASSPRMWRVTAEHCRSVFSATASPLACAVGKKLLNVDLLAELPAGEGIAGATGAEPARAADCGRQGSGDAGVYGDDSRPRTEVCSVRQVCHREQAPLPQ